jgi:diketogulonate reductase-like aldo/keto reductase
MSTMPFTRRAAVCALASLGGPVVGATGAVLARPIPSSGEWIPAVGLGSWITFNVGDDPAAREACAEVMRAFFAGGGRLIDSSPMYASSQPTIGHGLALLRGAPVFSADKVWTGGDGAAQIEASRRLWGVPRFDLLQVHNLLAWERQLPLLHAMKAAGRLRYLGISTSEGRRHDLAERLMRSRQPLDTVQLSYNPLDREAEERLLPLAQERGIAVIVNRPFREGALLRSLQHHPLPPLARELQADSWAALVLKFILGHPAVSCVIPATTRVDHVRQNLAAATGPLPDAALRRRIAAHIAAL